MKKIFRLGDMYIDCLSIQNNETDIYISFTNKKEDIKKAFDKLMEEGKE